MTHVLQCEEALSPDPCFLSRCKLRSVDVKGVLHWLHCKLISNCCVLLKIGTNIWINCVYFQTAV